jgi:hypothetical protein
VIVKSNYGDFIGHRVARTAAVTLAETTLGRIKPRCQLDGTGKALREGKSFLEKNSNSLQESSVRA